MKRDHATGEECMSELEVLHRKYDAHFWDCFLCVQGEDGHRITFNKPDALNAGEKPSIHPTKKKVKKTIRHYPDKEVSTQHKPKRGPDGRFVTCPDPVPWP